MLDFGHQHLSTYAIGKEYSKQQWTHLSRQFLSQELLVKDIDYGSLKITDKGAAVLFQDNKVFGRLEEKQVAVSGATGAEYDRGFVERLRP